MFNKVYLQILHKILII